MTRGERLEVGAPAIWTIPKFELSGGSVAGNGERMLVSVSSDEASRIAPRVIVNWRALVEKP